MTSSPACREARVPYRSSPGPTSYTSARTGPATISSASEVTNGATRMGASYPGRLGPGERSRLPTPRPPLQQRRRRDRGHDHHDDHGRVRRGGDDRLAGDLQAEAHVGEDETDLAARDHADADGQAIGALAEDAETTG